MTPRPMVPAPLLVASLGALATWLAACETTSPTPDPAPATTTASPEAGVAPPAPAAAAPAPVPSEPERTPAPAPAVPKTEVIDDENWLPSTGSAREAFVAASETARSDPAGAVGKFVDAANRTKYFYAAWFSAGAAAEAAGDVATAERHYRTALATRPDYGPALANLALLLTRANRGADARRVVDDGLRRFPERSGPHLAAATLAWHAKDLATVEREAVLAVRYDERSTAGMLLMGKVFRAQKRLDTARFALENALGVEPGNALAHLELGHVFLDLGDEKKALVSFEKAARLRPTLAEAQENYGVLLLKEGFAAEATRAFEAAGKHDPKSGRAQLHLGNGLRAEKRYADAEQAYKMALELDPSLLEARFNLGLLYIDNAVPGQDELVRLQKGLLALKDYQAKAKPEAAVAARLAEYIDATDKRIQKEIKRREREERRKREDAAAAARPPAAKAADPGTAKPAPAVSPPPAPPPAGGGGT
ncbi:MAG: tetratricopeptide repeat protein [Deltaproteobacteria bacterium]|nr:tetratricopeptide repeat protein [Deltaproteobacteria bacterium]